MYDQLSELESITRRLESITSIFNMMCELYFEDAEPNEYHLKVGYTDYTNVITAVREMVIGQRDSLHDSTDKLYKVYWELKKLSERNMAVLKGGASND